MKKTTLLLLSLFAVLLLGGCSKSSVSGSEPFVVNTPDVGRLTTVSHPSFYETGNGLIDAISFIGGKKVDDSVMLTPDSSTALVGLSTVGLWSDDQKRIAKENPVERPSV